MTDAEPGRSNLSTESDSLSIRRARAQDLETVIRDWRCRLAFMTNPVELPLGLLPVEVAPGSGELNSTLNSGSFLCNIKFAVVHRVARELLTVFMNTPNNG
jgi:hypothetical protein